jgi:Tfp pilus assembly protein PilX
MNFAGNANGYYTLNPNQGSVADTLNANNWSAPTTLTYSGPALSSVQSSQNARYVIELLPPVAPPGSSIAAPSARGGLSVQLYRITARGFGGDGTSTATLQSVYYIP